MPADLLIAGGDVVTMNPARDVLVGGTVAIAGNRIVGVGRTAELRALHPGAEVLDARGCVVTPGMVNAHQHHTGDPLLKSCIPDLIESGDAIFSWAVPIHGAHSPDHDALSATISAVAALRLGVTTVVEAGTVADPDRVGKALTATGIRGTVGRWGWDVDGVPHSAPIERSIELQREVLERWPLGGRIEGWVTLVGHSLGSDELFAAAAELARTAGRRMTMHMSPTSSDPTEYLARTGKRPLRHLHDLGVLGEHLLLAHGVWLDDEEVELVLDTHTAIAYCPWAYLRMGQGVTHHSRHAEIVERGGRVALGCDAENAGDIGDILRAAAAAAGIARDSRMDPLRFGADTAFELATIRGAEAIGMADRIGSLEVGKLADVVVHDATAFNWLPRGDVSLQLVWGTDGRTVRDVVVDGQVVVRDATCTTVDVEALGDDLRSAQRSLLRAAGIEVPHRWPHHDAT